MQRSEAHCIKCLCTSSSTDTFTLKTSIKTRKHNDLRNSIKNLDVQQHLTTYLTTKKKTDDDLLYLFDP